VVSGYDKTELAFRDLLAEIDRLREMVVAVGDDLIALGRDARNVAEDRDAALALLRSVENCPACPMGGYTEDRDKHGNRIMWTPDIGHAPDCALDTLLRKFPNDPSQQV